MAGLDQRKIEEIAANAVSSAFDKVTQVSPSIKQGDKGISFDGELEVFKGNSRKVSDYMGSIPVQVKGTTIQRKQGAPVKKSVSRDHLENYKDANGILYFVVIMNGEGNIQGIYYKALLPYDLSVLFDRLEETKKNSVQVAINPFPDGSSAITRICSEFLRDREKQSSLKTIGCKSIEDLKKKGIPVTELGFTKTLYGGESPFSLKPFENGTYIYAKAPWGESYVCDKIEPPSAISVETERTVSSGDIEFRTQVSTVNTNGDCSVKFGSFVIHPSPKASVNYADLGSFRDRFLNVSLLRQVLKTEVLYLDGAEVFRGIKMDGRPSFDVERAYKEYSDVVSLLDKLHVKANWDPAVFSDADLKMLSMLLAGIGADETIYLLQSPSFVSNVNINNTRIKVVVKESGDGEYQLYDLLDPDICFVFGPLKETDDPSRNDIMPVPSLLVLDEDDFKCVANIDVGRFEESCRRYPIMKETKGFICDKLLEMLRAYDSGAVCGSDLLGCCKVFVDMIKSVEETPQLDQINQLQVIRRMRNLSDAERASLEAMLTSKPDPQTQAAIYILLGYKSLAKTALGSMSESDRETFLTWPIANLLDLGGPDVPNR